MFGTTPSLNGQYTVIGQVTSGMENVDKLKKGSEANNGSVSNPDKILHRARRRRQTMNEMEAVMADKENTLILETTKVRSRSR